MKPETIRRLDELFARLPVLVGGAAPRSEVEQAEQQVGMKFDAAYRTFLECYGGAMIGSLPIFGLRHGEVMGSDTVVDVTARFRADGWKPTDVWVVISMDLTGNPIGLTSDGEVWVSDHELGELRMVARTFEAFVQQLLDEAR